MPNVSFVIGLTNGDTRTSDGADCEESDIEAIKTFFKDWRNLNYINMTINGQEYFYNPANVLWASINVRVVGD